VWLFLDPKHDKSRSIILLVKSCGPQAEILAFMVRDLTIKVWGTLWAWDLVYPKSGLPGKRFFRNSDLIKITQITNTWCENKKKKFFFPFLAFFANKFICNKKSFSSSSSWYNNIRKKTFFRTHLLQAFIYK